MTQYLAVDPTGRIRGGRGRVGNGALPETECPAPEDGEFGLLTFYLWDERISFAGPLPSDKLHWIDGAPGWARTLDDARADKVAEMSAACATAILSGFKSSALGTEHLYPTKITDQINLAGSLLDSMLICPPDWTTPFPCADTENVWARRPHTAEQIQQVGRECKAAVSARLSQNDVLQAQIATATAAELDTIHWPEPE